MQIFAFAAKSADEIDTALSSIVRDRADALLLGGDGFLYSRRMQLATLCARDKPPMIAASRGHVQAVLNLQTAKALGITVPPGLLARADDVIE